MNKELEALEKLGNIDVIYNKNGIEGCYSIKDTDKFEIIETALKSNKRKLDLIGEILVDISKGYYADLNDAINEIREVLEDE